MLLGLEAAHVVGRVARIEMLDRAAAVDPGDAVVGLGRARGAAQCGYVEARLATDRVADDAVCQAVLRVAGGEHGVVNALRLRGREPRIAHGGHPVAAAGELKAGPVDDRHAREVPSKASG